MDICKSLIIREYDFDSDIVETVISNREPLHRIYQPTEFAVVLGRGSKPEIELDCAACLKDGITVYQRPGGGCAVFIDPGNIIFSIVLPTESITGSRKYFNRLSQWLIGKLGSIGIKDIYQGGISDLVFKNNKVGGASIHRTKDYLYYTSTLLIAPQIELMEKYLKHPPREPEYRKDRSHREFVGRLPSRSDNNSIDRIIIELEGVIERRELSGLL